MNAPRPVIPAEIEARRRAASLAWRASMPRATPQLQAAAAMAEAAISYGTLAADHPPGSIRTLQEVVADAVVSGLSGRPAPERVTAAEQEQHAAKIWTSILRDLPPIGAPERAPA